MPPKLTKREMERERAAAAAAAAAAASMPAASVDAAALLPQQEEVVSYDLPVRQHVSWLSARGCLFAFVWLILSIDRRACPCSHKRFYVHIHPRQDGFGAAAAIMSNVAGTAAGGGKRRADEAFGGESQGSEGDEDAASKVSSASKSTAYSGSAAGGAKARKTPQRGSGAETPGGTPSAGGGDKSMKGLRHFSLKVCRKVEEKGLTNYNEVRLVFGLPCLGMPGHRHH